MKRYALSKLKKKRRRVAEKPEKQKYEPFELRSRMLKLDTYLRIFILPQIPAEHKEFREVVWRTMDEAWHKLYLAAFTEARERQKRLLEFRVELSMVEIYMREIREVCFRGKLKLDAISERRFRVCADLQKEITKMVWGWVKNEDKKLDSTRTQKTAGLTKGVK